MRTPREDRQVRYARFLGLVFCVAGFAAIILGWNGTARVACPDCQLPYLLSGGAAGLGLIVVGAVLMVLAQVRSERLHLAEQLSALLRPLGAATAALANGGSNGKVVAGESTYHRPDCSLVRERTELDRVPVETARAVGLSPCRICRPVGADDAGDEAGDAAGRDRPVPAGTEGGERPRQ